MIEDRVSRSYARTAKIAFYVITTVVGLLAATVATSFPEYFRHPIIALAAGLAIGVGVALPVAGFIAAWPVIRVLWWWTPEIVAALIAVYGFTLLSRHTPLPVRLVVVLALIAVAIVSTTRHAVMRVVWCLISRHRLRTCFNEFIVSNRSGSLPFILWAKPTAAGEAVWVWLRPGLSLGDLENRLDHIAVTCWAASAKVEKASASNAAYVRIRIQRRDALTSTVQSPLIELVDPGTPTAPRSGTTPPTALDLPDIPADTGPAVPQQRNGKRTERADKKPAPDPAATTAKAEAADDVLDWV